LLEGRDEIVTQSLLSGRAWVCGANVVDAFEDHTIANSWKGKDITVDARKCIRSEALREDVIATKALIGNSDL
jgi:hypothetical protein